MRYPALIRDSLLFRMFWDYTYIPFNFITLEMVKNGQTFNVVIFEFHNGYKKLNQKIIDLSIILRPINKDLEPLKWWIIKISSLIEDPDLDLELYWY